MAAAAEHPTVASLLQQQPVQQTSPPPSAAAGDSLACQWVGCGEHATSPEALYEHVCERHVGRKSTNNLNLQCQWGGCRTTTVKRDHITSHIRVHVPLKPHKCDFCGKSFKRPQDLKKHVKTHADDSILLRSPAPPGAAHAGYSHGLPKVGNGYYAEATAAGPGGGYGYGHSYPHSAIPPPAGAVHGYGGPGYPMPNMSMADPSMIESRKRGHDMLEQFFSDAKRRQIDAHNYMDLGARFGGLHGLQMGLSNGFGNYNAGYNAMGEEYGSTAAMAHYQQMPQTYSMFNELKTKSDLMSIDQFLEQLQNTVYENPDRSSPPNIQPGLEAMVPTPAYSDSGAPSLVEDTPTPSSNYSTNSPASVHSSFARTPNAGYPQLPSVNSIAGMSSGYNMTSVPLQGIGEEFPDNGRRRYSSSNLTRANPPSKTEEMDGATTPPGLRDSPDSKSSVSKEIKKADSSSPKSTSSITLPPIRRNDTERSEEERNEAWVENMRVIEHLRHYIQYRLEKQEFDNGNGDAGRSSSKENDGETTPRAARSPKEDVEMTDREKEAGSLYPVLRAVQASD